MGKYIFGAVLVLIVVVGIFVLGYAAGITAQNGHVCEMDNGGRSQEDVCIVDGVKYIPEAAHG